MSKAIKGLIRIIEFILAALLFIAVCFILAQVLFRYLFHSPLSWTEQTSRYLFIWMIMLGTPIIFYKKGSLSFDLLLHYLPQKIKFVAELVIMLLIILFSSYYGYQAAVLAFRVGSRLTTGVQIPLAFMYSSMAVSCILVIIVMLEQLLFHLGILKKETKL